MSAVDVPPPVPSGSASDEAVTAILQKFQRDINRTSDSDRMTRKRGLQKLLEDLPWKSIDQRSALETLFETHLLGPLIAGVADPVEKCRELSLSLLKAFFSMTSASLSYDVLVRVVRCLCDRVGEVPFLETAEELRLQVVELIALVLDHSSCTMNAELADIVLSTLIKSLSDTFPSVKRAGAELVCKLSESAPKSVRMCFKSLLKPLVGNATHQHSKTRSITVQAIGLGLSCVSEDDYETLMKDPVLPLLSRMAGDRSGATRKELANMCRSLLCHRLTANGRGAIEANITSASSELRVEKRTKISWTATGAGFSGADGNATGSGSGGSTQTNVCADLQLTALLLVLVGDESEEVTVYARTCLEDVAAGWAAAAVYHCPTAMEVDVDDGELAMQLAGQKQIQQQGQQQGQGQGQGQGDRSIEPVDPAGPTPSSAFLCAYLFPVAKVISEGVNEWTVDIRRRNLRGLEVLVRLAGGAVEAIVPPLLACLSGPIRDEDVQVRRPAEACCEAIGAACVTSAGWESVAAVAATTAATTATTAATTAATTTANGSGGGGGAEWLPLELLLPRVAGQVPGGDTFSQRTSALRLLTHAFIGLVSRARAGTIGEGGGGGGGGAGMTSAEAGAVHVAVAVRVAGALADYKLYEFREAALREAALLLTRAVIDACVHSGDASSNGSGSGSGSGSSSSGSSSSGSGSGSSSGSSGNSSSSKLLQSLVTSLMFLQTRCPGEDDIVPPVAHREMVKLALRVLPPPLTAPDTSEDVMKQKVVDGLLAPHFGSILSLITTHSLAATATSPSTSHDLYQWQPHHVLKAAFEVLIRLCPTQAWACHSRVLDIILPQIQPKKGPEQGSTEANMQSYAAVRGDEAIPTTGEVDVRLALLSLLEGLVRAGSSDWQCGPHVSAACERILLKALVPNLIWRVGRVEGTVRKVALAVTFGLMKAGAAQGEALAKAAPELVPLLCSSLDDNDETARLMSCLCLTVMFQRLRGAFGDQSIHELYPKLLKRLDDSSDHVRGAICDTLEMFMQAAHSPTCYSSTMIDYTLDQLFIHLDDPSDGMQEAVLRVVLAGAKVDKKSVLAKARHHRGSHRTPDMCDRVILDVQGCQVLDD